MRFATVTQRKVSGMGRLALLGLALTLVASAASAETIRLSKMDLRGMSTGWKRVQKDKSIDGKPLSIGGEKYTFGVGTHAPSAVRIDLHGTTQRFTAQVGVDDETNGLGLVEFKAWVDGKPAWTSGVMKGKQKAKALDLDLTGKQVLVLMAEIGGEDMNYDHADWANAEFTYTGQAPVAGTSPKEEAVILTPPAPPTPRINGARIFGVRPGSPVIYTIAATGDRPMTFAAAGLPEGLKLDEKTGQISGKLDKAGEYKVMLTAKNAAGEASRELRIVVGDKIALTPPMGWNSWNCWGDQVSQDKVLSSARAMVEKGLINHGWSYINIDDGWQSVRGGQFQGIVPNKKFPEMAKLATDIHDMGLKIGIYSTPWRGSYAGYIGGSCDNEDGTYDWIKEGHHNENFKIAAPLKNPVNYKFGKYSFAKQDVAQWAAWGIDYLKYDWNPNDVPHVSEMSKALRASGRDIVYSLSNSAPFDHAADWTEWANCWRTTGDINDSWGSVSRIGFSQDKWQKFGGQGHWNDPDMLVVGKVGWGNPHPSKLTPNEQYTHISLWCLLSAPLLIGCDMAQLDDFTLNLLTNDEVLALDQDPLGVQGHLVGKNGFTEVWAKPLEDGSLAVGLFNLGEWEETATANWADLKIDGERTVRDLWRQKDMGKATGKFEAKVPRHGVVLVKLSK